MTVLQRGHSTQAYSADIYVDGKRNDLHNLVPKASAMGGSNLKWLTKSVVDAVQAFLFLLVILNSPFMLGFLWPSFELFLKGSAIVFPLVVLPFQKRFLLRDLTYFFAVSLMMIAFSQVYVQFQDEFQVFPEQILRSGARAVVAFALFQYVKAAPVIALKIVLALGIFFVAHEVIGVVLVNVFDHPYTREILVRGGESRPLYNLHRMWWYILDPAFSSYRAQSLAWEPAVLAQYFALTLPFIEHVRRQWLRLAIEATFLVGVLLTRSTQGFILVGMYYSAVGIIRVLRCGPVRFRRWKVGLLLTGLAPLVLFPVLSFAGLDLAKILSLERPNSNQLRWEQFQFGLTSFSEFPLFGRGVGAAEFVKEKIGGVGSLTIILIENGILGLFAYSVYIVVIATLFFKVSRDGSGARLSIAFSSAIFLLLLIVADAGVFCSHFFYVIVLTAFSSCPGSSVGPKLAI